MSDLAMIDIIITITALWAWMGMGFIVLTIKKPTLDNGLQSVIYMAAWFVFVFRDIYKNHKVLSVVLAVSLIVSVFNLIMGYCLWVPLSISALCILVTIEIDKDERGEP